jgi:hypothetical protein
MFWLELRLGSVVEFESRTLELFMNLILSFSDESVINILQNNCPFVGLKFEIPFAQFGLLF